MPVQFINGRFHADADDGTPLVGGQLFTYASTTTTKLATYTDSTLATPNTNPIILNARGEASVWMDNFVYSFVLKDANNVTIWTDDGVDGTTGSTPITITDLPLTVTQDPFDADPTGVDDAVSAFQACINSTTDANVVVIEVPPGAYKGDFSTLSYGSRTIVWLERGEVVYTTSAPPGPRAFGALGGTNHSRPWFVDRWGFSNEAGTSTGTTNDQPAIYAVRNADHTGGTSGANPSAVSIQSTVGANVKNYEAALTVRMDESSTGDTTNGPNFVGAQVVGARHTAHAQLGRTYGMNIVVNDLSTRGAIDGVNVGGLIGVEVDIRASGPDTEMVRHAIYVQPKGLGGSTDGSDTIASGLLVRLANAGALTVGAALRIDDIGAGGSNKYNVGLYALAQIDTLLCDMRSTTNEGTARFGSTLATGMVGSVQLVGNSSTGNERIYGEVGALIGSATDGAENSTLQFKTLLAGTQTNSMQVANGAVIGAPAGSFKGAGTLNLAGDIYKNNTAYSNPDYVFEHAYTGQIVRFADNEGAKDYRGLPSLEETERITRETFKLPGMDGEPLGAFGRFDKLLQLVEEAYLHIFELSARLKRAGL